MPDWGLYCCTACGRLLELERVLAADVERRDGTATGYITFDHYCPCKPSAVLTSRRWGSYPSFTALFGAMPPLPYQAPFDWQRVPDNDPELQRWRWELGQVVDCAEFLLFAEDAAHRRAA
jgi:hypothetical protein